MGTFFGQKTRLMGREIRYNVRPRSDPGPANVRSVVSSAALGHTFLRVLRFSPVGTIPLILHLILFISRWQAVKCGAFKLGYVLSNIENWTDEGFHIVFRWLDLSYRGSKPLEVNPLNTIFDAIVSGESK